MGIVSNFGCWVCNSLYIFSGVLTLLFFIYPNFNIRNSFFFTSRNSFFLSSFPKVAIRKYFFFGSRNSFFLFSFPKVAIRKYFFFCSHYRKLPLEFSFFSVLTSES